MKQYTAEELNIISYLLNEKHHVPFDIFNYVERFDTEEDLVNDLLKYCTYDKETIQFFITNSVRTLWVETLKPIHGKLENKILYSLGFYAILGRESTPSTLIATLDIIKLVPIDVLNKRSRKVFKSIRLYLAVRCTFTQLGIPLSSLEYWNFEKDIADNLNATGYGLKSILRALIAKTRKMYGSEGVLGEILNMRFLMNAIPDLEIIYKWLHQISALTTDKDKTVSESLWNSLRTGGVGHLYRYKRYARSIGADMFPLMGFYKERYSQWFDGYTKVNVSGVSYLIHHHTVVDMWNELLLGDRDDEFIIPILPDSLNHHPKDYFKDQIQAMAEKQARDLKTKYKGVTFPELPHTLDRLDKSKWVHLNNPIALVQEGNVMRHCIGGDDYITRAADEGYYYFHYDDGTAHGLSIELPPEGCQSNMINRADTFTAHKLDDPNFIDGFVINQIYGIRNTDPSKETLAKVYTDLRLCSDIYHTELDPVIWKQLDHKARLFSANECSLLKTADTTHYSKIEGSFNCKVFNIEFMLKKFIVRELKWICADSNADMDCNITRNYPNVEQLLGRGAFRAGVHGHNTWLGGDFDGDSLSEVALSGFPIPRYTRRGKPVYTREDLYYAGLTSGTRLWSLSNLLVNTQYLHSQSLTITQILLNVLRNQVTYGFMSLKNIDYWGGRASLYGVNMFSPTFKHERVSLQPYRNGIYYRSTTPAVEIIKEYSFSSVAGGGQGIEYDNSVPDWEDPMLRKLLGYNGSVNFKPKYYFYTGNEIAFNLNGTN